IGKHRGKTAIGIDGYAISAPGALTTDQIEQFEAQIMRTVKRSDNAR
ncbi:hypothetical protein LCGC14_2331850, partial [marine sediment metagenome]